MKIQACHISHEGSKLGKHPAVRIHHYPFCFQMSHMMHFLSPVWIRSSHTHAAAAKLLQSCPSLPDPRDGSPPGSPIPGILQARTLEWVAISFSHAWKWKVKVKLLSRVWLLVTPWTSAYQAPPSMEFTMQEYWSGLPFPFPLYTWAFEYWIRLVHTVGLASHKWLCKWCCFKWLQDAFPASNWSFL